MFAALRHSLGAGRKEGFERLEASAAVEPLERDKTRRGIGLSVQVSMILTQQLILGVLVGGLYGLAAAGLSLTFGVLRVLNIAHGELLMLGGYGAFWIFTLWHIDPFISLLGVAPLMFIFGLFLYWALFQFVVNAPEELRIKNSLLIGFGLTLVLHTLAIRFWTADERAVTTTYAGAVLRIGPFAIPLVRLSSLLFAFAILAALHLFLTRARWGRAIRATAEDWEAAALMGIPVRRTYLLAFALGTALDRKSVV